MVSNLRFVTTGALSDEYSTGRTYVLNPEPLSWDDALTVCEKMNGSLATIRSMATVPGLGITG